MCLRLGVADRHGTETCFLFEHSNLCNPQNTGRLLFFAPTLYRSKPRIREAGHLPRVTELSDGRGCGSCPSASSELQAWCCSPTSLRIAWLETVEPFGWQRRHRQGQCLPCLLWWRALPSLLSGRQPPSPRPTLSSALPAC